MATPRRADRTAQLAVLRAEAARIGAWWRERATTGQPLTDAEYARVCRLEALLSAGTGAVLDYYEPTVSLPDRDPVRVSLTERRSKDHRI